MDYSDQVVEFASVITAQNATAKLGSSITESAATVDISNASFVTGVAVTEATSEADVSNAFVISNIVDFATADDVSDVVLPILRNAQIVEFASAGSAVISASVIFSVSVIDVASTAETTSVEVGDFVVDTINMSDATSIIIPSSQPSSPPQPAFPSAAYKDKFLRTQSQILKYTYTPIWKE